MCLRLIAETDARSVGDSHPSCLYCRRCQRIATTASVTLTNHSVVCGGETRLITPTASVTLSSMTWDNVVQTADITLHYTTSRVLLGTFDGLIPALLLTRHRHFSFNVDNCKTTAVCANIQLYSPRYDSRIKQKQ